MKIIKVLVYTAFACMIVFAIAAGKNPVTVFMIGDSTMSVKPEKAFPENGWGMALSSVLNENATCQNMAVNGRSTKSFIDEGRWDTICKRMSPGDYVIIQFGHNDAKPDSARHTDPQTTYKMNLRKFITDTQEKGANPILCTSIVRRHFDSNGKLIDTHGGYPQAVREVADEMHVPLIDLEKLTKNKINKLGPGKSKALFMIIESGDYPNFPAGKSDSTHLSIAGAKLVANLFVEESKKQKLSVVSYFKLNK